MKFTFICEDSDREEYSDNLKITHEFKGENLDGILEHFQQFLSGCSFQVQGKELIFEDLSFVNKFSADDFLNGPKSVNDITDNAN